MAQRLKWKISYIQMFVSWMTLWKGYWRYHTTANWNLSVNWLQTELMDLNGLWKSSAGLKFVPMGSENNSFVCKLSATMFFKILGNRINFVAGTFPINCPLDRNSSVEKFVCIYFSLVSNLLSGIKKGV